MTLEEAYALLDIFPDEDLDIDQLEENYSAKIANLAPGSREHKRIDEACEYLISVYDEIHSAEEETKKTNAFLITLTISMTIIAATSLLGLVYFLYSRPPIISNSSDKNYARILTEIEALKNKPQDHIVVNNPPKSDTQDYAALIEKIMPSMVLIKTSESSLGSGFFVSPNGDILTNYHVIENASYLYVTTHNSEFQVAKVKDYDSVRDIALIQINSHKSTPYLELLGNFPRLGDSVIAIGNPTGLLETVSDGIVSGVREFDNNTWVQFTAPISPGSSGGALVNLQGKVIGMPTQFLTRGQNLNFAVASTELSKFLNTAIHKTAKNFIPQSKKVTKQPNSPKQSNPSTPKNPPQKNSGIPLPDKKGFIVHKWGCSVDSVRSYVASPLQYTGVEEIYSTYKPFKAFKAKIDTVVYYVFDNNRLGSICFIAKGTNNIEYTIMRELTELYHVTPRYHYGTANNGESTVTRTWFSSGLIVSSINSILNSNEVFISFAPR